MILRQGNLVISKAMEESLTLVENTFEIGHFLNMQSRDFVFVTHNGLNFIAKPAQHFRVTDKKKAVCDHWLTFKDSGAKQKGSMSWRLSGSFS
jgi:hypothetical protein